jgi:hypothetical protein
MSAQPKAAKKAAKKAPEAMDAKEDTPVEAQAAAAEEKKPTKKRKSSTAGGSRKKKRSTATEEISAVRKREINHIVRRAKKYPEITPSFISSALRCSKLTAERIQRMPEYKQTLETQHAQALAKCTEDDKKQRLQVQHDKKIARLQRIEEGFNSNKVCLKGLDEVFLSKIKLSKPLSGYMLFAKETREAIQKANPESGFGEIGRKIGLAWKELGAEGHQTWKDKATQLTA